MLKPSKVLPTSPIKIFDFSQFQQRNPNDASARINIIFPPKRKKIEIETVMASDAAYPSIPSIKLYKFINHNIAKKAKPVIIILFSLWSKGTVEKYLHYMRVREIMYVLETAYISNELNPLVLDGIVKNPEA